MPRKLFETKTRRGQEFGRFSMFYNQNEILTKYEILHIMEIMNEFFNVHGVSFVIITNQRLLS